MRLIASVTCLSTLALLAGCNDSSQSSTSTTSSASASGSQVASIARPPTITGSPATTATVGVAYLFQPLAADPADKALSFSITGKPAWATFNSTNGSLSGTPTAASVGTSAAIVISVSDGTLTAALADFTITVASAPSTGPAAGTATVSWSAPTTNTDGTPIQNLAGYTIHYGTSATALNETIAITNATDTSYTLTGLASGTWYFAVSSVNSAGVESALSPTISDAVS